MRMRVVQRGYGVVLRGWLPVAITLAVIMLLMRLIMPDWWLAAWVALVVCLALWRMT